MTKEPPTSPGHQDYEHGYGLILDNGLRYFWRAWQDTGGNTQWMTSKRLKVCCWDEQNTTDVTWCVAGMNTTQQTSHGVLLG
ncbi:hypothetical protein Hamer_G020580 [Homarus americanus]|uniref:Uncharacterized protein n=1 Tax=Homarus americanus TaxID=6706 RepID=A0A8J5K624_HOMAM|nr:hypothetical protein Hamer_G020580 [Homarus americanus]